MYCYSVDVEFVQLHVLILCTPTPPPPNVMCCLVMLRAPTHQSAWDSHRVVVGCVRKRSYFSSFFGEADMILWVCFNYNYYFMSPFHPALLQKLYSGNAAHPPTLPKNNYIQDTYVRTYLYPATRFIPALRHPNLCIYQRAATHSFKSTHPLIPPSFFRFRLGWLNLQKPLGCVHSSRDRP